MTLYRMPNPGELRAICWDHNTCNDPTVCACECHMNVDIIDIVDRQCPDSDDFLWTGFDW